MLNLQSTSVFLLGRITREKTGTFSINEIYNLMKFLRFSKVCQGRENRSAYMKREGVILMFDLERAVQLLSELYSEECGYEVKISLVKKEVNENEQETGSD